MRLGRLAERLLVMVAVMVVMLLLLVDLVDPVTKAHQVVAALVDILVQVATVVTALT
jgi:hypothetical protein